MDKQTLRRDMLKKRQAAPLAVYGVIEKQLLMHLSQEENLKGKTVAVYQAIKAEVSLQAFIQPLQQKGAQLALPGVQNPNKMVFNLWDGKTTKQDFLKLPTGTGPQVVPSLIFVPLLAFARSGHRVGYGGGFYDKALALLTSIRTIGVAFSWQEVTAIKAEPHDQPLNEIWTESERILCPQQKKL